VPFLRLTRDRRGFENTFLMHADRPGDRPRLLYWYRTAPGIVLGRPALDEDAIRTIEEQHPEIDFDWPAILALSEVMTPEDEAAPKPQKQEPKRRRDKSHLRFVASQPCLVCGRQPSDPHHLRFAQPRALGVKVSDEFTVPLCRGHHRQLHQAGNEMAWWDKLKIDALRVARQLWEQTHPNKAAGDIVGQPGSAAKAEFTS